MDNLSIYKLYVEGTTYRATEFEAGLYDEYYTCRYKKGSNKGVLYNGSEYQPVAALNSKVQIEEDNTCSNTHAPSSKECPYKLVCNNC